METADRSYRGILGAPREVGVAALWLYRVRVPPPEQTLPGKRIEG
jgi:hypothetical protein